MSTNCISCGFGERMIGRLECEKCAAISCTTPTAGSAPIRAQCGPTAGCGEFYDMVETSLGVFRNPAKCPHCGKELFHNCFISNQPNKLITGTIEL